MKNLPEKKIWNEIKHRLGNYQEEPDEDTWNKIAAAIPSSTASGGWSYYTATALSIIALTFPLLLPFVSATRNTATAEQISEKTTYSEIIEKGTRRSEDSVKSFLSVTERTGHAKIKSRHPDVNAVPIQKYSLQEHSSVKANTFPAAGESNDNGGISGTSTIAVQLLNEQASSSLVNDDARNNDSIHQTDGVDVNTAKDSLNAVPAKGKPFNPRKKKKSKTFSSVYCVVAPSLAYQKIVPLRSDEITVQEFQSKEIFSGDRKGMGIEAGFQVPLNQKVDVYAGLSYYQQRQTLSYTYLSPENVEIGASSGSLSYTVHPVPTNKKFTYAMRNAGVSVGFWYRLKGDKLMQKVGGALQYQKGFLRAEENNSYDNASSYYLNYQLAYRLELKLSHSLHALLQPAFTHSLRSSERLDEPFVIRPYRASVMIGLSYNF